MGPTLTTCSSCTRYEYGKRFRDTIFASPWPSHLPPPPQTKNDQLDGEFNGEQHSFGELPADKRASSASPSWFHVAVTSDSESGDVKAYLNGNPWGPIGKRGALAFGEAIGVLMVIGQVRIQRNVVVLTPRLYPRMWPELGGRCQ